MLALTLFRLTADHSVDEYVEYSQRFIKPGMLAMPSVLGFRDLRVLESYDGAEPSATLIELIEIESVEAFKHDNESEPGLSVATDWATWVDSYEVLFCAEIPPVLG